MRNLAKLAGLGLGALLVFSVSEAGAMTSGMAPTLQPSALERTDGTVVIAASKGARSKGVSTSRDARRKRTRTKISTPSKRTKSRTR